MKRWLIKHQVACLLALLLLIGGLFRLAVVASWRAPAGDGWHFYHLSQELVRGGRYSLGPPPNPLTYVRMPGYPLFLAYVAVRQAPLTMEEHLVAATRANVVLDLGTAILVFLIIRDLLRQCFWGGLIGSALALACPMLFLLSCYGLSESLATFLTTLVMFLVLRAARSHSILYLTIAGVSYGLLQLVRVDAVTLLPAILLASARSDQNKSRWQSLLRLALFSIPAILIFLPWPLRNLSRFGAPHPAGSIRAMSDGRSVPTELISWQRTWASSGPGESYLDLPIFFDKALDVTRPVIVLEAMYDDEEEHRRVVSLFQRYNQERWSSGVIAGFAELARTRTQQHPLRTYLYLPLLRIVRLWSPVPECELPMSSTFLHLPQLRPAFAWWDRFVFVLALVGAIAMSRSSNRAHKLALLILLAPIIVRSALYSYVIPNAVTERYLVEVIPLLLVLSVFGLFAIKGILTTKWTDSSRVHDGLPS